MVDKKPERSPSNSSFERKNSFDMARQSADRLEGEVAERQNRNEKEKGKENNLTDIFNIGGAFKKVRDYSGSSERQEKRDTAGQQFDEIQKSLKLPHYEDLEKQFSESNTPLSVEDLEKMGARIKLESKSLQEKLIKMHEELLKVEETIEHKKNQKGSSKSLSEFDERAKQFVESMDVYKGLDSLRNEISAEVAKRQLDGMLTEYQGLPDIIKDVQKPEELNKKMQDVLKKSEEIEQKFGIMSKNNKNTEMESSYKTFNEKFKSLSDEIEVLFLDKKKTYTTSAIQDYTNAIKPLDEMNTKFAYANKALKEANLMDWPDYKLIPYFIRQNKKVLSGQSDLQDNLKKISDAIEKMEVVNGNSNSSQDSSGMQSYQEVLNGMKNKYKKYKKLQEDMKQWKLVFDEYQYKKAEELQKSAPDQFDKVKRSLEDFYDAINEYSNIKEKLLKKGEIESGDLENVLESYKVINPIVKQGYKNSMSFLIDQGKLMTQLRKDLEAVKEIKPELSEKIDNEAKSMIKTEREWWRDKEGNKGEKMKFFEKNEDLEEIQNNMQNLLREKDNS